MSGARKRSASAIYHDIHSGAEQLDPATRRDRAKNQRTYVAAKCRKSDSEHEDDVEVTGEMQRQQHLAQYTAVLQQGERRASEPPEQTSSSLSSSCSEERRALMSEQEFVDMFQQQDETRAALSRESGSKSGMGDDDAAALSLALQLKRDPATTSLVHDIFPAANNGKVTCPLRSEFNQRSGHRHGSFVQAKRGTEKHWRHLGRWHAKFLRKLKVAAKAGVSETFIADELAKKNAGGAIMAAMSGAQKQEQRVIQSWVYQALQVLLYGQ
jgi:hypothetical protein